MGEEAAAMVLLGPERGDDPADGVARQELRARWRATHADAWLAAERGFFDAVIHPERVRAELWRSLRAMQT